MKKTISNEILRHKQQVYEYYIAELSKGGIEVAKKNSVVIGHLKRNITLLSDPKHKRLLE